MRFVCDQGCVEEGTKKNPPPRICPEHGSPFVYEKEMKRAPLRAVSDCGSEEARRRGSTLKRGRGFAVTKAQRDKVRDLPCIVTGQDRHEATIHPMHVWDRSRGGCDDPLCVVPGSAEIHRLYDERKLDILPHLLNRGYFKELAHIIEAHEVSPTMLLERVTCQEWRPAETRAAA